MHSRKAPTLELPWSNMPVCPCTCVRVAYPGATLERCARLCKAPTLELPWSYPAPACPAPAYPAPTLELERPPCRGSRVGSPAGLGRFPLPLPSLPPRAPRPQGLPKPPRPPPTLELALDPGRAPRGGCGRAGDLGCRAWARGPIRIFRKSNLYGKPAKSTHGRTSGEGLPWSYPGARARGRTDAHGPGRERPRPARGEAPTLEPFPGLPYTSPRREGREIATNQTKRTREPLRAPPREDVLGKSRRSTAYPQQIVTTRLLYCLQDRFAQLSRLQRI